MWMWLPSMHWALVPRWWHCRLTSNPLPRRWHPWWFVKDRYGWWLAAWQIWQAWPSFYLSLLKGHLMAWAVPYQSLFFGRLDNRGCQLSTKIFRVLKSTMVKLITKASSWGWWTHQASSSVKLIIRSSIRVSLGEWLVSWTFCTICR